MGEEALDRTVWRTGFGRGSGPVVGWTTQWIHEVVRRRRVGKKLLFVFGVVTI